MVSSAILNNHGNLSIAASSGTVSAPNGATNFFIAASKSDIVNYAIEGSDLVIEFSSGQKLTIKNFFAGNATIHNLVLSDDTTLLWVDFSRAYDVQGDGIDDPKVIYSEIKDGGGAPGALLAILGGAAGIGAAVAAANSGSDDAPIPAPSAPPLAPPTLTNVHDDVPQYTGTINKGATTNDARPTFSGTGEAGITIRIYDNGILLGETIVAAGGSWTFTPGFDLSGTSHSITVRAVDSSGVESAASDPWNFILDVDAPNADAPRLEDNLTRAPIIDGAHTNVNQPVIVGDGNDEPGSIIIIYIDGVEVGQVIVAADGGWDFTPPTPLDDDTHTITVVAIDEAGNKGAESSPVTIIVDTVAPPTPSIPGVVDDSDPTNPVGVNPGDSTNDDTPVFSGIVDEPGSTVIIYDDGVPIAEVPSDPVDGSWSWTPDPGEEFDEGDHKIEIVARDPAGNESPPSPPFDFTVDKTPPTAVSAITAITDDTGENTTDFITNDQTLIISGTLSEALGAGEKVQIRIYGGAWLDATVTGSGLTWEYDHTGTTLAEGSYSIETRTVDAAGNETLGNSQTIIIDTTGNTAAIVSVVSIYDDVGQITGDLGSGSHTDDTTPLVKGTVSGLASDDRVFVEVVDDTGAVVRSGNAVVVGNDWTFAVSPALVADGDYTIKASVYDRADNVGSQDTSFSFTLDTAAPTVKIDLGDLDLYDDVAPVEGTIAPNSETDDNTPTFSGSAGSVDPTEIKYVNIYDNGVLLGTAAVNADGSWSFEPNPPIAAGPHNFQAAAVDAAGNIGPKSDDWDFTLLGAAPGEPAISRIDDNFAPIEGVVQKGGVTNDDTPVVSGTGTAGSVVHVWVRKTGAPDFVDVAQVTVPGSGNWTIELPALTAGDGSYEIKADAWDGAGQRSSMSGIYDIVLDTTAPSGLNAPIVTDNAGQSTGVVTSGSVIDDNRPVISGNAGTAEAGGYVQVYIDGVAVGSPVLVGSDGSWSMQPPVLVDRSTPYQISYKVTDVAGNESGFSPVFEVAIDTSLLVVSLTEIRDDVGTITGAITTGRTDDVRPEFIGTANAGTIVTISYVDGTGTVVTVGTAVADSNNNWSITPTADLPEGNYSFTIHGLSSTGNESSSTVGLTIDITAPVLTITDVQDDVGIDQGTVSSGGVTDDATPTFYGTTEAGALVRIYDINNTIVGSVTADGSGSWNITISALPQDGVHTLRVTATDDVGNESSAVNYQIDLDTTPKQLVANITAITDDSGVANDFITNDKTLIISGTVTGTDALSAGDRVQIKIGNGDWQFAELDIANASWTFDNQANELAEGSHMVQARVVDRAGNPGAATSKTIEIDLTGNITASVVITGVWDLTVSETGTGTGVDLPSGSYINDTMPRLVGTTSGMNITGGDRLSILQDGVHIGYATPSPLTGLWAYPMTTPLDDGSYTYKAVVVDKAGNPGSISNEFIVNIDTVPNTTASVVITGFDDDVEPNLGTDLPSDSYTNDTMPLLKGTSSGLNLADNDMIAIVRSGILHIGYAEIDPLTGNWTYQFTTPLSDGFYEFTAVVVDRAYNAGSVSNKFGIRVDTTPNMTATVTVNSIFDDVPQGTGDLPSGSKTNDATPLIKGQVFGITAQHERVFVEIINAAGDIVREGWTNRIGSSWTFAVTSDLTDQGEYKIVATVIDGAGNRGSKDESFTFILDTVAPPAPPVPEVKDGNDNVIVPGDQTQDNQPVLSGIVDEPGSTVIIYDNGVPIAEVPSDPTTGEWTWTPPSELEDGDHKFEVVERDPSGNDSPKSPPFEYVVDTTPPEAVATIGLISADTGVVGDFVTSDNTLAIYGTVDKPLAAGERVQIRFRQEGQTPGAWLTAEAYNQPPDPWNWLYDNTTVPLGDGKYTIDVRVIDLAGNITNGSSQDIEIDTVNPTAVAAITAISDDSGVVGDFITNDQTLIIRGSVTGTLAEGEKVQIRIDGGNWLDVDYDASTKTWQYDNQANSLSEASHQIDVRVVDKAGNVNNGQSRNVVIDLTGPQTAVAITGYNDDQGTIRGNITTNPSVSDDTRPRLYGTAMAENADDYIVIMVREQGTSDWTELGITAIVGGQWDYQVTNDLDDKIYEFKAVIYDKTGNAGAQSTPLILEIDTIAPGALNESLMQLWDDFGVVTGNIDKGGNTDDWTPEYRGLAGSVPVGSGIVRVHIYNTDPVSGIKTEIGIVNVNADGSWSFTPSAPLGLGGFQFSARGADAAGNLGPETSLWDFNVFAERIGTPAITDIIDDKPLILGRIEKGAVTDDDTPTVRGTGTAGNVVHVLVRAPGASDFVENGTVIVEADGTWVYTLNALTAGDGTYQVQVYSMNPTGGMSETTAPYPIVLDTTAPNKPGMPVLTDNVGNDVGIIQAGGTTDDNKPFMTGNVPVDEAGGTVTIYVDGMPQGIALVDNNGIWRFQPMIELDDGPHTVTVNVRDKAGNLSQMSDGFSFTVDTSGMPVKVGFDSFVVNNKEDTIYSGDLTNDPEPTLTGTATAFAEVVVSYLDGQGNVVVLGTTFADGDGDWMMNAPSLGDQLYNFTATASLNGESNAVRFTLEVDATPPDAPIITRVQDDVGLYQDDLPLPSGGITDDTTPTFYGTAEADSWIIIRDEFGTIVGTGRTKGDGSWVITTTQLVEGIHNLSITATDRAGNESGATTYTLLSVITTPPPQKAEITAIEVDTGVSDSDFITSSQKLIFKGNVDMPLNQGDKIQFRIDGGAWIDVTDYNSATGQWSLDYTHVTLSAGQHFAVVSVIDQVGNRTFANSAKIIEIDLDAPNGSGNIVEFVDDVGDAQGIFGSGSFTDDVTPLLRGNVSGADPDDRVMIYVLDDQGNRSLLGEGVRDNGGFSYQIGAGQELAQGQHRFVVVLENTAGNESAVSNPFIVNVDLTPATKTATLTKILDDTGISDSDFITRDGTLTYILTPDQTLSAGETVWMRITPDGGTAGQWRAATRDPSDGLWKLNAAEVLTHGDYLIESQVRNVAGNGGPNKSQQITIDTQINNNNVTIIDYLDNVGNAQGAFGSGTTTDDRAPVLRGILSNEPANDEMVVIYHNGVRLEGEAVTLYDGITWRWLYNLPDLDNNSTNTFVARVEDIAGNQVATPSGNFIINVALQVNVNAQNTIDTTPIISGSTGFDIRQGEYVTVTVNGKTYSSQDGKVVLDLRNNTWYVQIPDSDALNVGTYDVVARLYNAANQLVTSDNTPNELTIAPQPTTVVGQGGADPNEKATAVTMDENGRWMIFTNQAIMKQTGTSNFNIGNFSVTQVQSQKGGSNGGNNYVQSGTWMDYNRDGYMDFFGSDNSYSNGQQAFLNNGNGTWRAYHVGLTNNDGGAVGGTGNGANEAQTGTNPGGNAWVWYGGTVAFDKTGNGFTSLVYGDQTPYDPQAPGGNASSIVINTNGLISGFTKDPNFQGHNNATTNANRQQDPSDMELSGVDLDNNGTIDLVFHATTNSNHIGKGTNAGKPISTEQRRLVVASNEGNGEWNVTQIVENVFQRVDDDPNQTNGVAMTWADFNGDGYMDLFIGRTAGGSLDNQYRSRIHFNDGNGKIGMSDPNNDGIGIANNAYTFNDNLAGGVSIAIDWNHDGRMDVIEMPTIAGGAGVPAAKQVGPINLYTNQGGGSSWTTTNLLGGNNTIGNALINAQGEWVTGAVAIDVDWDGARDLLVFTRQGNTRYIHNENKVAFGTSLHFKILDAEGINAFYGNTVQLYNSAGQLVGTQMINPQSGNQTNDSTAIVDFYGLNANDSYTLVMLHHNNGNAYHFGGKGVVGGRTIQNVNAGWDNLKAGEANHAYVLTAESGTNVANANKGNGIVGTGYNDTFIATRGTDAYFGAGGTVTVSGVKQWSNDGGVNIVDYRLAGNTALNIDLSITTYQNTGFNSAKFVGIQGIRGGNGNDTFTDNGDDNVFNGGRGNDTYNLIHGGRDTIIYEILDNNGVGGNGTDTINGFTIGTYEATPDADRIDLKALLVGYVADADGPAHYVNGTPTIDTGDTIADYLDLRQNGNNAELWIDRDGAGGQYGWSHLVTLNGINDTTLAELLANHQIVVG